MQHTTEAAVLVNLKAPLELWELEIPPLKPGQVLVSVAYSGLCHSQLNEINGLKGEDAFLPHTLGHEGSGTVIAVGPGVSKVKPQERVVLTWLKGSGMDVSGTQYRSSYGPVNSGAISTFLNHAIIAENRVVPISDEMPLREAALLGCAIPTGAGVIKNEMEIKEGNSFAVFGAGGVGLSALLAAHHAKAYPRVAIDVLDVKLERAKQLGATHTINARLQDPIAALYALTAGQGVDYVFESAGKKEAMEKAFLSLKNSGLCVLAGNLPKGEQITIDPFELIKGKRLIGTWGGKSHIDREVPYYVDLFMSHQFPLSSLITHEVPLKEINSLIAALERGEVGRGLICFQ